MSNFTPGWAIGWHFVDLAVRGRVDDAGLENLEAITGLASWILDIPLALVLLATIGAVHRMQMDHHSRDSSTASRAAASMSHGISESR